MTGALPKFYGEALHGETAPNIWAGCAIIIAFGYYTVPIAMFSVAGFISGLLAGVFGWQGVSPYSFPQSGETVKIIFYQFMSWAPMTIGVLGALWFGQKYLRKRPLQNLIMSLPKFRWRRALFAFGLFFGFIAITTIAEYIFTSATRAETILSEENLFEKGGLTWVFDPGVFWASLPVLLLFIPLNAAMQEILFRGFIDQALARFIPNLMFVFMISAALFALWHIGTEGSNYGRPFYLIDMFIFGVAMSMLTRLDGGLEAAIGIHTANNMFFYWVANNDSLYDPVTWALSYGEPSNTPYTVLIILAQCAAVVMILSKSKIGIDATT